MTDGEPSFCHRYRYAVVLAASLLLALTLKNTALIQPIAFEGIRSVVGPTLLSRGPMSGVHFRTYGEISTRESGGTIELDYCNG